MRPFSTPFHLFLFISILILSPFAFPFNVTAQGCDVSVSTDDIAFDPATPNVGDEIEISVVVRNSGDTAENVAVAFYLGDELIDNDFKPVVPASATAFGTWDTTGLTPGDYTITVKAVAQDDTNRSNNNASKTVTLSKRPEAIIKIKSLSVPSTDIMDGDLVEIMATIANVGDANATVAVDFEIGQVKLGSTMLALDPNQTKNALQSWDTTGYEGDQNVTVRVGNVTKTLKVTVGHMPEAAFEVERVWMTDKEPLEKTTVRVYASIKNVGDAPAEIVVVFKANTKSFAKTKPRTYAAGENRTVYADWTATKGKRVIRVEVEGYPDATNHFTANVQDSSNRGCAFSVAFIGVALAVGGVGLVRYKRKGKRRV